MSRMSACVACKEDDDKGQRERAGGPEGRRAGEGGARERRRQTWVAVWAFPVAEMERREYGSGYRLISWRTRSQEDQC